MRRVMLSAAFVCFAFAGSAAAQTFPYDHIHVNVPDPAAAANWYEKYFGGRRITEAPDRLIGLGQTALRSPEEGIADLERMKELGLRGVMIPGFAACWEDGDYDDPRWDPFWRASIELGLQAGDPDAHPELDCAFPFR